MILKYRLEVKNNTVEFQVLEQKTTESFEWKSSINKNKVCSETFPHLYRLDNTIEIYLKGRDKHFDNMLVQSTCSSPSEAHRLAATIHETLEEWAKSQQIEEVSAVNVFVI